MSVITPGESSAAHELPAEHCGQCGAPAAHEQRYCVECGFHRRNAPDPVTRYLGEASVARARVAAAAALAARRRRAPRFGLRAVALLMALALITGVLIGIGLGGGLARRHPPRTGAASSTHRSVTRTTDQPVATRVRNATGSSYLRQEQSLPNSVTP